MSERGGGEEKKKKRDDRVNLPGRPWQNAGVVCVCEDEPLGERVLLQLLCCLPVCSCQCIAMVI